jgi:hypothetical protein
MSVFHKDEATPKATTASPKAGVTAAEATPREGTEPAEGTLPHHGGGFAKIGGAYSGGCVREVPPEVIIPPPDADATATKKK